MIGNLLTNSPINKMNYRKHHHFDRKNDLLITSRDQNCHNKLPSLKYESSQGNKAFKFGIPDWITFNNQILRFYAVSFDRRGSSPVIKPYFYHISYFLEDDTIQIIDKSQSDDLKFQGAHLKKHKISKKGLNATDDFFQIDDFNINENVVIYNKTYQIYDCDQFTRNYLTKLGVIVPERNEDYVQLQQVQLDRDFNMRRPASCPTKRSAKKPLRQFLQYDGKILTFQCLWLKNPPPNEKLLLLYYLADDTIEIRESVTNNSFLSCYQNGRPPPPRSKILVHRSKIQKKMKCSPIPDGNLETEFFTEVDLTIGSKLDVWGRTIFLYDCDEFTKSFLNLKYGLEVKAVSLEDMGVSPIVHQSHSQQLKERSKSAHPTNDKKLSYQPDFVKFIKFGPTLNDSYILRFKAQLLNGKNKFKTDRNFIISYHLIDDTVTVYESPQRNTGYIGGLIMQKCKVDEQFTAAGQPLRLNNFIVGAIVCINGHCFQLNDTDEYTLNFMEKHSDEFPASHRLIVLSKLKRMFSGKNLQELKCRLSNEDLNGAGILNENIFEIIIRQLEIENERLSIQELITLKRNYCQRKATKFSLCVNPIFSIQNELRAQHFVEFNDFREYLRIRDYSKCGYMAEEKLMRNCVAYPLPVKKYVIEQVLKTINSTEEGIDYIQFVDVIDWKACPASVEDSKNMSNLAADSTFIEYKRLLKDVEELNSNG